MNDDSKLLTPEDEKIKERLARRRRGLSKDQIKERQKKLDNNE